MGWLISGICFFRYRLFLFDKLHLRGSERMRQQKVAKMI